ncbi:MAG: hypothetical protein NWP64_05995, partial [Maribacter sp.]|nr:hypothetical protein [Maribacter sp.]
DFLNPPSVNEKIKVLTHQSIDSSNMPVPEKRVFNLISWLFAFLNFPVIIIWRLWLKSKVPEDEFMGTFRFAFAMISYPIYMTFVFALIAIVYTPYTAISGICILTLLNVGLVKYALK